MLTRTRRGRVRSGSRVLRGWVADFAFPGPGFFMQWVSNSAWSSRVEVAWGCEEMPSGVRWGLGAGKARAWGTAGAPMRRASVQEKRKLGYRGTVIFREHEPRALDSELGGSF